MPNRDNQPPTGWRARAHEIIFEAETPAGKGFDVVLLWSIVLSVTAVILESVPSIKSQWGSELRIFEWSFTLLFTLEYILRLACVNHPLRYAGSFFGVIDLLAILPSYLSLLVVGTQSLLVIRGLRLLRVFRIFKLARYSGEAGILMDALRNSRHKITVFLGTVLLLVIVLGTLMYLIEGEEHGFNSIPVSIYWAVVTMTTVGYGDISPQTPLGQTLASAIMIIGYGIIAVPTGIVTVELAQAGRKPLNTIACPECMHEGHSHDAVYCRRCGGKL